jgi:hypothetical protein
VLDKANKTIKNNILWLNLNILIPLTEAGVNLTLAQFSPAVRDFRHELAKKRLLAGP